MMPNERAQFISDIIGLTALVIAFIIIIFK